MGRFFGKKIERAFLNAAKKGDLARIESLLDNNRGLDLDNVKTSIFGKRPLHLAAENDHAQVVEFLLAKGANVNATEREMTNTPLHLAACEGYAQIAELLLSKGADINAQNTNGSTPLWEAVIWGRMRMVEVLIAKGADVNARAKSRIPSLIRGATPLWLAKDGGHEEIVELLRNRRAIE